ncbi:MAG: YIP1 family protein [Candidatus Bipolaricaulota bacterium]|nr:YIP1 family protein [Candidatus Bipolaricaulota bacterium]MDW8030495.1 Yip1 family protein [Candidatus Bipolaricaulota bacterium]
MIWRVFLYPDEGLQRVARQQPVGWAIALIASVTFVYALVSWTDRTAYDVGYPLMCFMDKPWKAGLTSTAIALLLILISSAALHWISWLFGGQGSYPETLSALGFAGVPPGIVSIILKCWRKIWGAILGRR